MWDMIDAAACEWHQDGALGDAGPLRRSVCPHSPGPNRSFLYLTPIFAYVRDQTHLGFTGSPA